MGFIFDNNIVFGLLYGGIALVVLIYLVFTMNENGVQFTFNLKTAIRERKKWRKLAKERLARGEIASAWGHRRQRLQRQQQQEQQRQQEQERQ